MKGYIVLTQRHRCIITITNITQLRYPIKRVSDYTQQRRKRYNEYSSVLQQVWGYRF